MRLRTLFVLFLLLLVAGSLAAHDLFLRLDSFFVLPNTSVQVRVLNGTFSTSENTVTRDRLRDLSLVTPAGRMQLDTAAWSDRGDTSTLVLRTGSAGTYVLGASIRPREISLEAKEFNQYLADDGIPDVLEMRKKHGELDRPARERYSKHVKAIVQVGSVRSDAYRTVLGYPAELVPLSNPYELAVGDSLRVRALVDGRPIRNQLVLAGGRTPNRARIRQYSTRTDALGVVRVPLRSAGQWYVKFIHMAPMPEDSTLDYESKWTTLTFEVR